MEFLAQNAPVNLSARLRPDATGELTALHIV